MMGQDDLDSWSDVDTAEDPDARASKAGGAAAGSLMSVQIRRVRKRPPPAPAAARGGAQAGAPQAGAPQAGEPLEHAAAQSTPQPTPPGAGAVKSTHETRQPEDITAYWSRLRGSRPYPAASDLDSDRLASDWPNSILFRCRSGSDALEPDTTYRPRHSGESMAPDLQPESGLIDLSPMMLQWLLSLAGDAVRHRRPVEDTESFPSARHSIGYRAVALPLSANRSAIDHVLCHVRRA
jgi:hypothetical protein